jgi:Reverse transcriptase (RNA-dependent DNA polymerase)
LRRYLEENMSMGLIEQLANDIASPILFVKKKDCSLRLCVDYRQLNNCLERDMYPLPRIDSIIESLSGKRVFSKIDLREAYHQIRMHEKSRKYSTFICKYGSFCYNVMPFRLSVPPSFF